MSRRHKWNHVNALGPHYGVRGPLHANLTGRPEPSPLEVNPEPPPTKPEPPLDVASQLRPLALFMLVGGVVFMVGSVAAMRPVTFLVSAAVTAAGFLLFRIVVPPRRGR
jgi:hypothetical protein